MKRTSWVMVAVMAGYMALALAYALTVPVFEKPDENWHFAYIKSLADGRGFPAAPIVVADDAPAQESSQPPLYYVLAAGAVRVVVPEISDLPEALRDNPAFPYRDDADHDNKNRFVHAADEAATDTARAVRVARIVAVLFGAVTVWATYRLALEIKPDQPAWALLAAAIVAFTPQFVFICSAASNDSAAAALCAVSLWLTARIMRHGRAWPRLLMLGIALALGALSKASAIGLLPLSVLAISVIDRAGSTPRGQRVRWAVVPLIVCVLLIAPWYMHSWAEFGDPLGTSTHFAMPWARTDPLPLAQLPAQLPGAIKSYWLAFGWGNLSAPDWVYTLFHLFGAVGLLGAASVTARSWRDRHQAETRLQLAVLLLAWAWLLVIVLAFINWIRVLDAALGRLVFPAIAALALLLAAGWQYWLKRSVLSVLPAGALATITAAALIAVVWPAYAPPAMLDAAAVDAMPGRTTDVRFEQVARLIKVGVPAERWPQPGENTLVTLCWEPLTRDDRALLVLVQLVGQAERVIVSRRTLPGLGAYPIDQWRPGGLFCDRVHLALPADAPAPALYQVEVALIDQATSARLTAFSADNGLRSTNFVAGLKLAPERYTVPNVAQPLNHQLGGQLALIGYAVDPLSVAAGGQVRLRLYWRALRAPDHDYTVFVHVRDDANQNLMQADGAPQGGVYPTSYWDAGEVVIDDRVVDVPPGAGPGEYPIVIGLYNPLDNQRLTVTDGLSATEIALPVKLQVRP